MATRKRRIEKKKRTENFACVYKLMKTLQEMLVCEIVYMSLSIWPRIYFDRHKGDEVITLI